MEDSTSCRAPQSSQAFSPKCKSANMAILKEGFPLNPTPVVFSCCSFSSSLRLLSSTVISLANAMSLVINSNQRIVALVMVWTITIFFILEARRNQKLHKIWGLNWMRSCELIKNKNQWRTLGTVIYLKRMQLSGILFNRQEENTSINADLSWSRNVILMLEVLPQKGRDCLLAEKKFPKQT